VTKSLNTALINIHQKFSHDKAVHHIKQSIKGDQHHCVFAWQQTMFDDMQTHVVNIYGSTIPQIEAP